MQGRDALIFFMNRSVSLDFQDIEDQNWEEDLEITQPFLHINKSIPQPFFTRRDKWVEHDVESHDGDVEERSLSRCTSTSSIDIHDAELETPLVLQLKEQEIFDSFDLETIPDLETHTDKTRCSSKLEEYKETDFDFELDLAMPDDGITADVSREPPLKGDATERVKSILEKYKEHDEEEPLSVVKKPMPKKPKELVRQRKSSTKPPIPIIKPIERKKPTYQVAFGRTIMEKPKPKKPTLIQNLRSSHKPQSRFI
jgi:hypothetical protein